MIFYSSVNLILIAAAVIPAVALMVYVYRADKLEKEPTPLLWRLILQGIISTALAVFTERLGAQLLSGFLRSNTLLYQIIFYFLIVGLSEEGFKYLLLKRRTWDSPFFNCRFDGVVYAVFVSMGFALWENIDYVVMFGLQTAFVRALTAVPGHACFGVFMGAWYGLAKSHERHGHAKYSRVCRNLAVICPVLLHGLYDLIATLDDSRLSSVFIGFIAVMFLAAYWTVKRLSARDRYI
ncbi:MAG: PrsW family intramembrane metalloprotease [Clostridia bacterium]|nr:PrsW family intramembrane metalloprotease [Clostridia bacterium]